MKKEKNKALALAYAIYYSLCFTLCFSEKRLLYLKSPGHRTKK